MITYEIHTQEDCLIRVEVEGQHVAAALDDILGTVSAGGGLVVPHLAEGLILRIATVRAIDVINAAQSGNCMPGMVLVALDKIKRRALFWHNKAVRHASKVSSPPAPSAPPEPPPEVSIPREKRRSKVKVG